MRKSSHGITLLGVYLVVEGLSRLLGFVIPYRAYVLGVLALSAGILLLVRR